MDGGKDTDNATSLESESNITGFSSISVRGKTIVVNHARKKPNTAILITVVNKGMRLSIRRGVFLAMISGKIMEFKIIIIE